MSIIPAIEMVRESAARLWEYRYAHLQPSANSYYGFIVAFIGDPEYVMGPSDAIEVEPCP